MIPEILEKIVMPSVEAVSGWFTETLEKTNGKAFYIAIVFIVFACGFLLSNFRNGMRAGSDLADKVATYYVRRQSGKEK